MPALDLTDECYQQNEKPCGSWKELMEVWDEISSPGGEVARKWIFRGQKNACFHLKTALERTICDVNPDLAPEQAMQDAAKTELSLLRAFQREAHLYLETERLPLKDDYMEWLALMRHYKVPTRLLDWTHSFHVAAYFAVQDCDTKHHGAVWALDHVLIDNKIHEVFDENNINWLDNDPHAQTPEGFILRFLSDDLKRFIEPKTIVHRISPYRANERIRAQMGLFLASGNAKESFESNLRKEFEPGILKSHLWKIVIQGSKKIEFLKKLNGLNVSAATLYPGLDGFGESMREKLISDRSIRPDVKVAPFVKGSVESEVQRIFKYSKVDMDVGDVAHKITRQEPFIEFDAAWILEEAEKACTILVDRKIITKTEYGTYHVVPGKRNLLMPGRGVPVLP